MKFFDNHAHLDDEKFDSDRENIIKEIKDEEIGFISAGYNLDSSKKAIELSKKFDFIYSTCGISPNDIAQSEEKVWKELKEIEELAKNNPRVLAIGEIGLDYYWEKDEKKRELQQKVFIKQIDIANKLNLPIVIHTRDAVMDTIKILKENKAESTGVFHCCPLNRELVKEALKLGFYISFAGPITFKNSKNANEIIEMVPIDKILIETDSPYLSPEPFRGKRNDPRNVKYVAKKISEVKGISIDEVGKITYENVKKIYKICNIENIL